MRLHPLLTIVAISLMTAGCFEEPVREHVHLSFLGGGAAVVTTVQEVAAPWEAGSNPALAGRLDDARSELESGWDRWRPLYDQLQPAAERYSVEMVDGLVRRATYGAVVASFDPVEQFFGAEGLSAVFFVDGTISELQLYPVGGTRATRTQRQLVEAEIDVWAAAVADYLGHAIALYTYLEQRPDRAVPCLAHIFDEHGPDPTPLEGREERLVLDLKPAIERVADVLLVPDDRAFTPNELVRLAFDPFPARLTVALDGHLISSEGFTEHDGFLERPRVDLWTALQTLEGQWVSPDLVTAMVVPGPEDQQPEIDPVSFAALPRRFAAPPNAAEVSAILRQALVPRDVHVLRWRPVATEAPDFEDADPLEFLKDPQNLPPI